MKTFSIDIFNINAVDVFNGDAATLDSDITFEAPVTAITPPPSSNSFLTKGYFDDTLAVFVTSVPNAVPINGSLAMTGALTLRTTLSLPTELVSKTYVDTKITASIATAVADPAPMNAGILASNLAIPAGSIIRKPTVTTPTGFFKVNGAVLNKETYSAIYSTIGDSYTVMPLTGGGGQPWRTQATINTSSSGVTTGWVTETPLDFRICYGQVVITKNKAYLIGGWINNVPSNAVYMATISSGGILGAWTTVTVPQLPGPLVWSNAVLTSTRLYMLGGYNGSGTYLPYIYYAPVNPDGTLGTWVTETVNTLPGVGIMAGSVIVTNNRVYLVNGYSSTGGAPNPKLWTAIITNGVIGPWTVDSNTPPVGTVLSQVILTKRAVYILGGYTAGSSSAQAFNTIWKASINVDGTLGPWITYGGSLPEYSTDAASVSTSTRIYLLGGYNRTSRVKAVRYVPINVDSTLGTWASALDLPQGLFGGHAIITSTKIYFIGGSSGGVTGSNTIYSSTFAGGRNDYMNLPDTTGTSDSEFTLPNLTVHDSYTPGLYSYIKI